MRKIISLLDLDDFSGEVLELIKSKMTNGGVFVGLSGNLGAGKSTFCKRLFAKMGVADEVVSPTYVLNINYKHKDVNIEHLDVWRVEKFSEILNLGFKEMIENESIVVVEWADKFKKEFEEVVNKEQIIWIHFEQDVKENHRIIELQTI